MPINTAKEKIDHLLTRRVASVVVEGSLRKKLEAGKKLRIKHGVDPTAPDIHLGHAVVMRKLREFQDMGHQVILLIGDYTALVGDPTGKSKTRPMLTKKEVDANAKTYLDQVGKILDLKKTEVRRNSEWFAKMPFTEVIKLAGQFTVARMVERDDFAKRLEGGVDVHMHELLYPMMQAYDSIELEADVEIGGTDQTFNMLAGRDLQRKMGKPEQDVMCLGPILVGTDGVKKMSKSLNNYVGLTDAPVEMYGKVMSIPDSALWDWFAMATDVDAAEIADLRTACQDGAMNPRDAKMRLASEIVKIYHTPKAAVAAEEQFKNVFQKKEIPDEIKEVKVPPFGGSPAGGKSGTWKVIDLLVEVKFAASKGEARRLVEGGGVKIDGEVVKSIEAEIEVAKKKILIQKGKRHFVYVLGK